MEVEIVKCYNPNIEVPMCRECMRKGQSKDNNYEAFALKKTLMNGWKCDGYLNKNDWKLHSSTPAGNVCICISAISFGSSLYVDTR